MTEETSASEEVWLPVPTYEGIYEVSNLGRVRRILRRRGTPYGDGVLKHFTATGYAAVRLCDRGRNKTMRVHKLVSEAFIGPRPDGMEVRHLDGDKMNPSLSNLAYGTSSENNHDIIRHGRHLHANKTHCKRGHEFDERNTYVWRGGRFCRTCHLQRNVVSYRRKNPVVQRNRSNALTRSHSA